MRLSFKKKILILFIGIIIIISLSFFQGRVKNFSYLMFSPLQKILWQGGDSFSDFWEGVSGGRGFKKENEELEKRYQELLEEAVILRELKEENKVLREALNIGLQKEFKLTLADLISRDVPGDSILINKGLDDGLMVGMPVITEQKVLLGRISEVYKDFSRLTLISDPESSFPVEVQEEGVTGIIKGIGNLQISLEKVPRDKEVKEGDIVITSSLGKIFPRELLVGRIEKVHKSDVESFQKAEISPFLNIEELESVFIITDF